MSLDSDCKILEATTKPRSVDLFPPAGDVQLFAIDLIEDGEPTGTIYERLTEAQAIKATQEAALRIASRPTSRESRWFDLWNMSDVCCDCYPYRPCEGYRCHAPTLVGRYLIPEVQG